MYLKRMVYKNVGPLENITINMPFTDEKTPKPLIIVGENGSGKSTLLSNIVDSFYEIAGVAFDNVRITDNGNSYKYYKIISPSQITIGKQSLYSYIRYDENVDYIFKCGKISFEQFQKECEPKPLFGSWEDVNSYKTASVSEKEVKRIFEKNIFAFFGPERYERPNWMGEKFYNISDYEHPYVKPHYNGMLYNPISVKNVTAINLQWLLDLIVDSRADIQYEGNRFRLVHYPDGSLDNYIPLGNCRKQIERILSQIIKQDVYFDLNIRNQNASRFNIKRTSDNELIVPQLDALSTGEIALFNMFSTVVKYADRLEINNSIHLENIKGIVIIDEIELHLHGSMQKKILPKLIKLFPKVQFVITTHSPLFLLGMKNEFGDSGFEIYQMPTGIQITAESFSEFQRAFDYMTETQQYQNEVQKAILEASNAEKPLIITEGATDWRHIKAALNVLSQHEKKHISFNSEDIDFLEFDSNNSNSDSAIKLEMGNSTLCNMCREYAKVKQSRKMIFVADRDDVHTNKILGCTGIEEYKSWGNNVYSILLPVPPHRSKTPDICIEHYYTDDEIKTSVDIEGISRRLYIANEFDEHGRGYFENIFCEKQKACGAEKINIIEGSQGEKVLKFEPECNQNLALSKMEFANRILKREPPFDKFCFDSFLRLFEIISEILKLD